MIWTEHLTQDQYEALRNRIGDVHLAKRLSREAEHNILQFGGHGFQINWESLTFVFALLERFLRAVSLFEQGAKNALDYEVVERKVFFENLPEAFHGYRILHLSDLHLDAIADRGEKLQACIRSLSYDLCVMTGDYRFANIGRFSIMMKRMEELVAAIRCPDGVYGILGNHDFIEMVPGLEAAGVKVLVNETIAISRGRDTFYLAGVDDEHFYEVADVSKVSESIPKGAFAVLLSHSQELIARAARQGFQFYLCGHTHGGQICLPGGIPIITNTGFGKRYIKGFWRCGSMQGYTSRGVGSSGLAVRYRCPPEIVVHTLLQPSAG